MLIVLAMGWLACTSGQGGWDEQALSLRYPGLTDHPGQRLGDARPYFAPGKPGLILFLCRWPSDRRIAVSLPLGADADERRVLKRVLEAWEAALSGVAFYEVPRPQAQVRIDFVAPDEPGKPQGSANTTADCRVDMPDGGFASEMEEVDAALVRASVHLRRENTDLLGRPVPLAEDQLAGTALHEIGHALGYPSHAVVGDRLMGRSVDHVRREGKRVLSGGRLVAPSVEALYEVPSGVVVGTVGLSTEGKRRLRSLERRARSRSWRGPEVRVGDRSSRFWWWDERGRPVGFLVVGSVTTSDQELRLVPTTAAREQGF